MNITDFDKDRALILHHIRRKEEKISMAEKRDNLTEKGRIEIRQEIEFIKTVKRISESHKKEIDIGFGRLPPQDVSLEIVILGAIILESFSINSVVDFLLPSHFYSEKHKIIYGLILNLYNEKLAIDMHTVVAGLKKSGHLELCGGHYYIAELTSKVSRASNLVYHSRLIIEHAIKRELIMMAGDVLHKAYSDTTDCFNILEETGEQLKDIEKINTKK